MQTHGAPGSSAMLERLAGPGPDPEHGDELALFGQFAGSWDLDIISYADEDRLDRFRGEWQFGWVLQGRAVQDVLITRSLTGEVVGYGSTVRSYDAKRHLWWIVWQDPLAGEFSVLLAKRRGDDIVLEGRWTIGNGEALFRWTFLDVKPDSFQWQAHISRDAGQSWRLAEEMHARRLA